ncbi:elongation factor P [Hydrogenispora ethanolica]|uniref:Elongation factor P n=1 Tax=Hydrogenispora ethanolica TaxID=1082276 RepID=A0A4V2QF69_HYDET|nr:elongation factor P [Hydrogenispora ethanolica]TCL70787.1 elongation factor P [Hydrogenispora ethanolica]
MISVTDFKTGLTIEIDGDLYTVVDFMHVKPGKGAAFVRSKLKNIRTGYTVERTFNSNEKVENARIDFREMQFLYKSSDDDYTFMDMENYEQLTIPAAKMGDAPKYLKENMIVEIQMYQNEILGVELPNTVELEVVETDPNFKGDTATGGTKPATLETGAVVNVPFFVTIGDVLQVDTRTNQYLKRVNK